MRCLHASRRLVCALAFAMPALATSAHAQKASRLATMSGKILADSSERPLFGAQISVPALRITVTADSLGNFRLNGIEPGRQLITVTHMGFAQLKTYVAFAASDTVDADILLTPIPVNGAQRVAKVSVTADAVPRGLEDFERRRQNGIGDFLTEDVIRKTSHGELTDVVRRIPGIQFSRPQSGFGAYASAGRGANRGRPCFVAVMIDRTWVYEGKRNELPFDLNSISPDIVVAMEYYRGMSYVPAEFGKERTTCGTLIIWTRQG